MYRYRFDDGVNDVSDLDDDNDGILDTVEVTDDILVMVILIHQILHIQILKE